MYALDTVASLFAETVSSEIDCRWHGARRFVFSGGCSSPLDDLLGIAACDDEEGPETADDGLVAGAASPAMAWSVFRPQAPSTSDDPSPRSTPRHFSSCHLRC